MAYLDGSDATEPDDGDGETTTARYIDAIERYDRGTEEWRERCEKITKIYLDQHRTAASPRRFALLWSNIETLKPAVYARLPVAVVSRRFKDPDPVGRRAGEILERCINSTFDLYGLDDVLQLVRDDRLLVARGQAWVRYEAEFEPMEEAAPAAAPEATATAPEATPAEMGEAEPEPEVGGEPVEQIKTEYVCCEFVHWADFGHSLHRTWPEVTIAWRRVYMTKPRVKKRFGKAKADKLTYQVRPEYAQRYGRDVKDATEPQAVIYEIWDKEQKRTTWMAKEEKITLEAGEPPLNFRNFFPCPKPCYGTRSTSSLVPIPDYRYYQDQAEEINDLTEKIGALQEWLVLKAFVPSGPSSEGGDAIVAMVQELQSRASAKGIFIPVESWAGWSEKGGSRQIDWLPMDMVIATIKASVETRQQLLQDVYQITGISDILRGETDPNETLGAQQIKAQTGSRRIQTCQRDLARFARDIAELVGEIIAEVFQPETMAQMSGFDLTVEPPPEMRLQMQQLLQQFQQQQMQQQIQPPMPPGPGPNGPVSPQQQPNPQLMQQLQQLQQQMRQFQQNQAVIQLLRDEKTRGYRIEIETDSTIEPDEQAEKQRRIEFLGATGEFFKQALPVLQMQPRMAPMLGEMLLFMVRGFRAGRQVEDTIEAAVSEVTKQAQQPPPPDPKMEAERMKLEAEKAGAQADMQMAQQKHGMEMQKLQAERQRDQENHVMEMQKQQVELEKQQADHAMAMRSREVEHSNMLVEHEAKAREMMVGGEGEQGAQAIGPLTKVLRDLMKTVADLQAAANKPRSVRGPSGRVYHFDPRVMAAEDAAANANAPPMRGVS